MSDWSQGPGWWQASDGKWYPPSPTPQQPPPPPPGAPLPPAGPPLAGPPAAGPTPWFHKTWVLVVSLVFCFPVGLVLTWTNKRYTQKTKVIITAVVLVLAVIGGISNASSPPEETVQSGEASTTSEQPPTTEAPTTTEGPTTTDEPTTSSPPTTAAPTTAAPTTTAPPTTTEPPGPTLTASQEQAVRSAESYLDFSGFSRQGLIDQLSSEYGDQFSVEDATIAVDSLTVDWNAEAVESAESYLEFSGFSCQGLIDQLSSDYGDQYTVDQATFAANQVGLC